MARQGWLDGAFYGKLGDTVGYRVGDKTYVRRYVVPKTPQTPDAIASRQRFAAGSRFAQVSLNLSKNHGGFGRPAGGEFSKRTGQSTRAIKDGSLALGLLPAFILHTGTDYKLSYIALDADGDEYWRLSTTLGVVPPDVDHWRCAIYCLRAGVPVVIIPEYEEWADDGWSWLISDYDMIHPGDTFGFTAWLPSDVADPYIHTLEYSVRA